MKVGAFEVDGPLPEIREPHALARLQPWVDVGSVGTLTLTWLETHFGAREIARLARPGDFFDFTRYRPSIYVKDGQRQMSIPNTYVTYSQPATGHGFLFLHLLEPHARGEDYVDSVVELLTELGAKRYCLLGSMYDYVPHTRPLIVTGRAGLAATQQKFEAMGITSSDYQGPTTITSLIAQRAPALGIETISLIVHLPQYTQLDDDYMGTVQLIEVLRSFYDMPANETYIKKAEEQLEQINAALSKNPELKGIIEHLEAHYAGRGERKKEEKSTPLSPEVEKFLGEMEKRFREGQN